MVQPFLDAKWLRTSAFVVASWAYASCVGGRVNSGEYDIVIVGGMVVDGSGSPARAADLGISGDRVTFIGQTRFTGSMTRTIDASGMIVAPGFIDLHAHLDPLLALPSAESHARQGVTTALGGPDGSHLGHSRRTLPLPKRPDSGSMLRFSPVTIRSGAK